MRRDRPAGGSRAGIGMEAGDRRAGRQPGGVPPAARDGFDQGAVEPEVRVATRPSRIEGDSRGSRILGTPRRRASGRAASGGVDDPPRALAAATVEPEPPSRRPATQVDCTRSARYVAPAAMAACAQVGIEALPVETPARPVRIAERIDGHQLIRIPATKGCRRSMHARPSASSAGRSSERSRRPAASGKASPNL